DVGAAAGPGREAVTRHLGLDLGATNLKWAVLERARGAWTTVARDQVATRSTGAPDHVPAAIVSQLAEVAAGAARRWGPLASVGVGVPGRYDPASGTIRVLVNVPGPWNGVAVASPVAAAAGAPTALVNDARAFGLAELRLGAGADPGVRSLIGLTLGTGVGGVIVLDGRVLEGHDGSAGELGHQTIDPDGPWCGCGNRGCVEAYARADQIAAACRAPSVEAAVRAAEAGDPVALAGLAEVGRYLGIGIANAITLLSPDRVVVGGGVAAAGEHLFGPIRSELERRVNMTSLQKVTIVPATLGTWAGAIGAGLYGADRAESVA
ncbi:MAG TPA: ROK family protein, partial [Candidatus Binatus sp.]|nr:ROK family protein [Candidatus Binatus sp.]